MTPRDVEARLAVQDGPPDSATVAAVLALLRDDQAWTVTEITVNGRLVQVDLVYEPTGAVYTLRTRRRSRSQQDADSPASSTGAN